MNNTEVIEYLANKNRNLAAIICFSLSLYAFGRLDLLDELNEKALELSNKAVLDQKQKDDFPEFMTG